MDAVLVTIDKVVRSIGPVDTLITLAAKRLLPKFEAAACPSIYCGRYCLYDASSGPCEPTLQCWLGDWYSYDSFCSLDCVVELSCCHC